MTENRSVTVTFAAPLTVQLEGEPAARRTIAGLAVPFGVPSGPAQDGERYLFTGPPANAGDLVDVVRGHDDDHVIGRLAAPLAATDAGLAATARIFGTSRGDDALVEATEGVLTGFSLSTEVAEFTTDPDTGVRTVGSWSARHLGVVRRPAFEQSAGLQVAASAHTDERTPTMTTTEAAPATYVQQLPTIAELAAEVTKALNLEQQHPTHPLAQFAREADYLHAVWDAPAEERARLRAAFAIADQTTTDNPGVIPPGWRSDIKMALLSDRPAIDGTGGSQSLPDAGMDVNWPYFNGDLLSIIAKQAAEKTVLSGPKISILKAGAAIETAGVVTDISYQLLLRSSPAYLEAYMAIVRAAWSQYTERVYEDALEAAATDSGVVIDPTDPDAFAGALFTLSRKVKRATGRGATVVGVASDVFDALGQNGTKLPNPNYGTQNVSGTSSASELRINLNGLDITEWPYLDAGNVIATNSLAARFSETGALTASSEDVTKLGRDVAVWGMYVPAEVYFPAGVQLAGAAVTP